MARHGKTQFILASASPRRAKLLSRAGYNFEVIPSNIDEAAYPTDSADPVEHTKMLALAKAKEVAKRYPDQLVMGADTIVDFDGKIIGKPADAAHAEDITKTLFSAPHKVITAVAFVRIDGAVEIAEAETTMVYPKKLSEAQIAKHIKDGDWRGKAGAYGIQESGDEFVERIEGSFTNVIGLPMELVERLLKSFSN